MDSKVTNNELLCELYLCSRGLGGLLLTSLYLNIGSRSICNINCKNTDINKKGCDEEMVALPTGELVRPSDICNDACDVTQSCEDEANCNGYLYGMYCMSGNKLKYVTFYYLCNNRKDCDGGEDEEDCTVTPSTESSCKHFWTNTIVPVHNYTRCLPVQKSDYHIALGPTYCSLEKIASYQSNCSDPSKVAVACEINGYLSTVSKYMICFDDEVSVCDDHIDSSCYSTKSCKVHKHLLCDQNIHCNDRADELHPICLKTTKGTCKRRVGAKKELPIPISWLRDGLRDCEDGIDETAEWLKCGKSKTSRYMINTETECKNVFICKSGSPGYELLDDLCDGLENCGNENEICSISHRSQRLMTKVSTTNEAMTIQLSSHCHFVIKASLD